MKSRRRSCQESQKTRSRKYQPGLPYPAVTNNHLFSLRCCCVMYQLCRYWMDNCYSGFVKPSTPSNKQEPQHRSTTAVASIHQLHALEDVTRASGIFFQRRVVPDSKHHALIGAALFHHHHNLRSSLPQDTAISHPPPCGLNRRKRRRERRPLHVLPVYRHEHVPDSHARLRPRGRVGAFRETVCVDACVPGVWSDRRPTS